MDISMLRHFSWYFKEVFSVYASTFKRLIDVVVSGFLIIMLAPFLALIALLIKLTDPGPILFHSQRVGQSGEAFKFYKFRSMPVNTAVVASNQLGQVNMTWFGKLIRRSNLDELPQLWNICKGDMSIVGPRPSLVDQQELVELRRGNGSLDCRPGLTGLAQVNSYDGMPVEVKARFDSEYASRITLLGDLKIVLKTISYLTKSPPVY